MTAQLPGVEGALLERMTLIRRFEEALPELTKQRLIRGSTHPAIGMEAVAVGMTADLSDSDSIVSNHRGHGHCLAKGASADRMMAEILGRETGYCRGRGGSMHIGVKELGILGTNGIVGGGIGVAVGSALAASVSRTDDVTIVFFGDGALNQGALAEGMNAAAIWKLPVIFVCENNHYAQSAPLSAMMGNLRLTERGTAYGVPSSGIDGMDVRAVRRTAAEAIARARSGDGPTFVVADTYRFGGHNGVGDTEAYRSPDEVGQWRERDPLLRFAAELIAEGAVDEDWIDAMHARVDGVVADAVLFARESPDPVPHDAFDDVYERTIA